MIGFNFWIIKLLYKSVGNSLCYTFTQKRNKMFCRLYEVLYQFHIHTYPPPVALKNNKNLVELHTLKKYNCVYKPFLLLQVARYIEILTEIFNNKIENILHIIIYFALTANFSMLYQHHKDHKFYITIVFCIL